MVKSENIATSGSNINIGVYTDRLVNKTHTLVPLSSKVLDVLLTEYGKVQDSAEHHDLLNWQGTIIFLTASGGLIVFILNNLNLNKIILFLLSIFGIIICFSALYFCESFREVIHNKYDRAKIIENMLLDEDGTKIMKQHTFYKRILEQQWLYWTLWITLIFSYIFITAYLVL